MEAFLAKVPAFLQMASLILSAIVVVATVVVKITPSSEDDAVVRKVGVNIFKVMAWLPFFGVDPRLKQLQGAFEAAEKKDEPVKPS